MNVLWNFFLLLFFFFALTARNQSIKCQSLPESLQAPSWDISKRRLSSFERALSRLSVPLRNVSLSVSLSASLSFSLSLSLCLSTFPFLSPVFHFPSPITHFIPLPPPHSRERWFPETHLTNFSIFHIRDISITYQKESSRLTSGFAFFLVCWIKHTPASRETSHSHLLQFHFEWHWLSSQGTSAPKMWVLKLLRFLMRPLLSIIAEKIAVRVLLRRYPLHQPHLLWLDWIAEIAVELSGSLQQHRCNLGSAGSLILFTLLLLLPPVLLQMQYVCRRSRVSAHWNVTSTFNLAERDTGQDILHDQRCVDTWTLRPSVKLEHELLITAFLLLLACKDSSSFCHEIIRHRTLMPGDKACQRVGVPVHPQRVWWGWGQGSM